jgi:hypothetical protein
MKTIAHQNLPTTTFTVSHVLDYGVDDEGERYAYIVTKELPDHPEWVPMDELTVDTIK